MENLHVEFDLPVMIANQAGLDVTNISQEIRRGIALFLFERNRISLGKACELSGMSIWEFTDLNRQMQIPFHYKD